MNDRVTDSSSPLALWTPVVLYMALIFAISSISEPPELPTAITDKGAHALLYVGLGALLVRALAGGWLKPVTGRVAATSFVYATLYGVTDEVHQYFVTGRDADILDVVSDAAGAAVAAAAFAAWTIIRGRHGL